MSTENTFEQPGMNGGVEALPSFVPTPERVSQYLDLKTDEVEAQMSSVEGRKTLFDQLMAREEDIRAEHPDFQPELLQEHLDIAAETLEANRLYLEDVQAPEKKGLFRRAWDSVKAFPKNHPVVTALLGTAAVAAAVAGGLYAAGYWELAMITPALTKIMGTAEAVSELAPITPEVAPLPGGGVYDIPVPVPAPGEFPDIPY